MKKKTLWDCISFNSPPLRAFVKDPNFGVKLDVPLGVLICKKTTVKDIGDMAKFFYKLGPEFEDRSDIFYADFPCSAKVISEIPLVISADFNNHYNLRKTDKEYMKAKKLLKSQGLY